MSALKKARKLLSNELSNATLNSKAQNRVVVFDLDQTAPLTGRSAWRGDSADLF